MRKIIPMFAAAALCMVALFTARAADEKTITGDATCAKCALSETKSCQNVVLVKDGDKEVKYYMEQNKLAKDSHGKMGFCKSEKTVKVTGEVTEKDGKKIITPSKIEVVEK